MHLDRVRTPRTARILAALSLGFIALGAAGFHLTLIDSRPKEGATLTEAPSEIWLRYNEAPDPARSGISLRGPDGAVKLAKVQAPDSLSLSATIPDPLTPGEYTVSWMATPKADHAVRGRYKFTIASQR